MKFIAVLACPSGVAHTYLASEALKKYSALHSVEIFVETQGALGINNELEQSNIDEADIVILSKDIGIVGLDRFEGKKVVYFGINDIVTKSEKIILKLKAYLSESL